MSGPAGAERTTSGLRSLLRRLAPLLLRQRLRFGLAMLLTFLTLGSLLAFPLVLKRLVDEGTRGTIEEGLRWVALLAALLAVKVVADLLRVRLFQRAALSVALDLQRRTHDNLLRQEIAFFDREHPAELSSRLDADVAHLRVLLAEWLPEAFQFLLYALGGATAMALVSPLLCAVLLVTVPVLTLVARLIGVRLTALQRQESARSAAAARVAHESFSGVRTIRVLGQEAAQSERYAARLEEARTAGGRRIAARTLLTAINDATTELTVVVTVAVGGAMIHMGALTTGDLVAFFLFAALVARALRNLAQFTANALGAAGALDRVVELSTRAPREAPAGRTRPAAARGRVELIGVELAYPTRPGVEVLRGLDLQLAPGEAVALVGASGAGKSTIAALLAGLYAPDRGQVRIDGVDLRELDPTWLREQVCTVRQDEALFEGTVAANLRLGRADADQAELEAAARLARADELIAGLPRGWETDVGERGLQLSAGQRQRLALARALLRRPRILVLDEATNALDADLEAAVKRSILALEPRPTLLLIAHRLSTIADADRVVLLAGGRVLDQGPHTELLERCPAYRELLADQVAGSAPHTR